MYTLKHRRTVSLNPSRIMNIWLNRYVNNTLVDISWLVTFVTKTTSMYIAINWLRLIQDGIPVAIMCATNLATIVNGVDTFRLVKTVRHFAPNSFNIFNTFCSRCAEVWQEVSIGLNASLKLNWSFIPWTTDVPTACNSMLNGNTKHNLSIKHLTTSLHDTRNQVKRPRKSIHSEIYHEHQRDV